MNKKLFLIPTAIVGMSLVACGSKPNPQPEPETYNVSLGYTSVIDLDNKTVTQGQDFDAHLTIKDIYKDYCYIPSELTEVTSNRVQLIAGEGYTFTKSDDTHGSIHIPSEYITGDIVITLAANRGEGNITFVSQDVYTFSETSYLYGDDIHGYIDYEEEKSTKYDLPKKIKVTTSENAEDITEYCSYNPKNGELTIPAVYKDTYIMGKEITITPEVNIPQYTVTQYSQSLIFSDFTSEIKKGEVCTFKMSFKPTYHDLDYLLPSSLSICSGTKVLTPKEYSIAEHEPLAKEAQVTIKENVIVGNLYIRGEGQEVEGYAVELDGVGVTMIGEYEIVPKNTDYHVTFKKKDGHELPKASNVVIRFGSGHTADDWIPAYYDSPYIAYEIIDDEAHLTIKKEIITGNITIAAKASDIDLLTYMTTIDPTWANVSDACGKGYAYYLFDIGEISAPFEIDGIEYQARLIGIDRDKVQTIESRPAAMTFEFTTCISTPQYFGKNYKLSSYYYKEAGATYQSALYEYLNKTLVNKLPFAKCLYNIDKDTIIGSYNIDLQTKKDITRSSSYLFPLSLRELGVAVTNLDEHHSHEVPFKPGFGKVTSGPYEYYVEATDETRIKQALVNGVLTDVKYWTRSPYVEGSNPQTYTISATGKKGSTNCRDPYTYVAPAFCL